MCLLKWLACSRAISCQLHSSTLASWSVSGVLSQLHYLCSTVLRKTKEQKMESSKFSIRSSVQAGKLLLSLTKLTLARNLIKIRFGWFKVMCWLIGNVKLHANASQLTCVSLLQKQWRLGNVNHFMQISQKDLISAKEQVKNIKLRSRKEQSYGNELS